MALSVSLSSPAKFQDRRSSAKIRYGAAAQVGVELGLRPRGAVALTTPDGETAFWTGGESFSTFGYDAVRFMTEPDADATIVLLKRFYRLSSTARTLDLGEIL